MRWLTDGLGKRFACGRTLHTSQCWAYDKVAVFGFEGVFFASRAISRNHQAVEKLLLARTQQRAVLLEELAKVPSPLPKRE